MDLRHFRYAYEMNAPGRTRQPGLPERVAVRHGLCLPDRMGLHSMRHDVVPHQGPADRRRIHRRKRMVFTLVFRSGARHRSDLHFGADAGLPESFGLSQNFPNPFNASTTIRFSLKDPSRVRLTVVDVRGALVDRLVEGTRQAGRQTVVWNGCDRSGRPVASGTLSRGSVRRIGNDRPDLHEAHQDGHDPMNDDSRDPNLENPDMKYTRILPCLLTLIQGLAAAGPLFHGTERDPAWRTSPGIAAVLTALPADLDAHASRSEALPGARIHARRIEHAGMARGQH